MTRLILLHCCTMAYVAYFICYEKWPICIGKNGVIRISVIILFMWIIAVVFLVKSCCKHCIHVLPSRYAENRKCKAKSIIAKFVRVAL